MDGQHRPTGYAWPFLPEQGFSCLSDGPNASHSATSCVCVLTEEISKIDDSKFNDLLPKT